MKALRKIALGFAALVFLTRLWMQSWLGPEEGDEAEDEWPLPPPE